MVSVYGDDERSQASEEGCSKFVEDNSRSRRLLEATTLENIAEVEAMIMADDVKVQEIATECQLSSDM